MSELHAQCRASQLDLKPLAFVDVAVGYPTASITVDAPQILLSSTKVDAVVLLGQGLRESFIFNIFFICSIM